MEVPKTIKFTRNKPSLIAFNLKVEMLENLDFLQLKFLGPYGSLSSSAAGF
jgi:hypothetical protein